MMKTSLRFCSILLMCLILATVCSCNGGDPGGDDTSVTTTENTETTTAEQIVVNTIPLSEMKNGQIVYDGDGENACYLAALQLQEAIQAACGVRLVVKADVLSEEKPYEILVGECEGREEAIADVAVRLNDYYVTVVGTKLVLNAGCEDLWNQLATDLAASLNTQISADADVFCTDRDTDAAKLGTYEVEGLTLNGVPIWQYTVVYPSSCQYEEKITVQEMLSLIATLSGYRLKALSTSYLEGAPEYAIRFGLTAEYKSASVEDLAMDDYKIEKSGKDIVLLSTSAAGYLAAAQALVAEMEEDDVQISKLEGNGDGVDLTVMSFNVLYKIKGVEDDGLSSTRVMHLVETVLNADPDVIGFQEVTPEWRKKLILYLGDTYELIGEGRDGGDNGEYTAIMYRRDAFNLLDSKTVWLSDTPDVVSKYSESSLNRIMTYAVLERISDGKTFVHMNTHLEHTSNDARKKQLVVLLKYYDQFKEEYPVFMTGDFNLNEKNALYESILNRGFTNSSNVATIKALANTSPSSSTTIDFCFFSGEDVSITSYRVDTTKYDEKDPSDHCPVIVKALFR
ncbi:MAG: endonuclease/exonuclease/phosphatase family protein [Clostridia bacterium]|nr:endonuclease/exonuclease/phosphatase family protein [Clostridia bacterium]